MIHRHRWSGWPGAFCLKCGQDDRVEYAIGSLLYDPYNETWADGVTPSDYANGSCPISKAAYEEHMKRVEE